MLSDDAIDDTITGEVVVFISWGARVPGTLEGSVGGKNNAI